MPNTQTETITKIQLRRGSTSDRTSIELSDGEPGWDTAQKTLYVGQEGVQYPAISVPALGALQYDAEGQLVINFTAGSETVAGFDYTAFSDSFATYLADLPKDNETRKALGTAVGGAVSDGSSSLVGPATQTDLGSVIVPGDGGIEVAETGSISVKLGDGIKVNASDGTLEVDTGDGLDIKDGKVVPKLAPGLAIAADGSLGVDASPAGTKFVLFVDTDVTEGGNNGTDGDLYSTWAKKTAGNKQGTYSTSVGGYRADAGGKFKTIMGAYLYALGNLPRGITLEIAIMSSTCRWNDPVAHVGKQETLGWEWNRQLTNVAPASDKHFDAFQVLKIYYSPDNDPNPSFPAIVSVPQTEITVDINRTFMADDTGATTTDVTKGHGFASPLFIFYFTRNTRGNLFQDLHFKFDFTGSGSVTFPTGNSNLNLNALIRFAGNCGWSIYNLTVETVGHLGTEGAPQIYYLIEVMEGPTIYFVQNLKVDVTSLATSNNAGSQIYRWYDPNTEIGGPVHNTLVRQSGPVLPKTLLYTESKFGLDLSFPNPDSFGGAAITISGSLGGHLIFGKTGLGAGKRTTFDTEIGVNMANSTTIQHLKDEETAKVATGPINGVAQSWFV
jgi:hypothetical protein